MEARPTEARNTTPRKTEKRLLMASMMTQNMVMSTATNLATKNIEPLARSQPNSTLGFFVKLSSLIDLSLASRTGTV